MSLPAPADPSRQVDDPWLQTSNEPARSTRGDPGLPPKGWYPDPPALRFWDGRAWTVLTRPVGPPSVDELVEVRSEVVETVVPFERPGGVPSPSSSTIAVRAPQHAHPSLTTVPSVLDDEPAVKPRIVRELMTFVLVALLALGVGAVVAALGITLTV